jgi:sucrose phosphorylase
MNKQSEDNLEFRIRSFLEFLYPQHDARGLTAKLLTLMDLDGNSSILPGINENWNEHDAWLITYGDSLIDTDDKPLKTLEHFLESELEGVINGVHILPFFPYSSDDGFSVIDYTQVNDALGNWQDIESIASKFKFMSDLVINHCSKESEWFQNYKARKDPGQDYFVEASPDEDLSLVVRPRTSPLLQEVETSDGKRHVWCTFSHDQIDLNFANPQLLCEIVSIIKLYLDHGIRIFRLDAIAYLWKEPGTNCIHLPQTHAIIRLLRTLIEHHSAEAILITETNVPNHENLSYFGNSNEAHAVYNFSLPPLLLHALISGTSKHLRTWQMSMPPALMGTFYFNFIASHDGIGLRPAEGLLDEEEIDELVSTLRKFNSRISYRTADGGKKKPYEINATLYDALQGTLNGPDQWQLQRYMCTQAIMFAMEGIPAIYIHSLLGTNNYLEGVEATKQNRTINRYKWRIDELKNRLTDTGSHHHHIFTRMKELLRIRTRQPAFHPNAVQFTLQLGDDVFGFWRQSRNRDQSIFCLHNVTDHEVVIPLSSINLISFDTWIDLVGGQKFDDFRQDLELQPYQYVWLSNKIYAD